MNVRFEIYCHACHYQCINSLILECEDDITCDDPDLSKLKCLLGDRQATWESDDF
ncbi:MAG: hypothetical protein ACT6FG_00515 [Methanosarcinaceae archaeon]